MADIWNSIKDTIGEVFSKENFNSLVDQIKSAATEENWNNVVDTIKNGLKDVTNTTQIKTFLDSVKGQVKDTSGKFGKVIQCLEKDIKDTTCLDHVTQSNASSIQVR